MYDIWTIWITESQNGYICAIEFINSQLLESSIFPRIVIVQFYQLDGLRFPNDIFCSWCTPACCFHMWHRARTIHTNLVFWPKHTTHGWPGAKGWTLRIRTWIWSCMFHLKLACFKLKLTCFNCLSWPSGCDCALEAIGTASVLSQVLYVHAQPYVFFPDAWCFWGPSSKTCRSTNGRNDDFEGVGPRQSGKNCTGVACQQIFFEVWLPQL